MYIHQCYMYTRVTRNRTLHKTFLCHLHWSHYPQHSLDVSNAYMHTPPNLSWFLAQYPSDTNQSICYIRCHLIHRAVVASLLMSQHCHCFSSHLFFWTPISGFPTVLYSLFCLMHSHFGDSFFSLSCLFFSFTCPLYSRLCFLLFHFFLLLIFFLLSLSLLFFFSFSFMVVNKQVR